MIAPVLWFATRPLPLALILSAAIACSRSTTSAPAPAASSAPNPAAAPPSAAASGAPPLVEITSASEEGFHDLVFNLVEREKLASGAERLRARGKHRGAIVQFDVELEGWTGHDSGPIRVFAGYVTLKRIGEDASLVVALDDVYGTKLAPKGMRPATKLNALALDGDPRALDAGGVRIKLFHEHKDESRYAELFLNVDVAKRIVELREKDAGYRAGLVKALAL